MGIIHAAYGDYSLSFILYVLLPIGQNIFSGLGAFTSPFIATQFAQLPHWSFHFLVSLGIAMTNSTFLICVFKLKHQDGTYIWYHSSSIIFFTKHHLYDCFKPFFPVCLSQAGEIIPEKDPTGGNENSGGSKEILTDPAVHLLAFFMLFYVGVELTIGGTMLAVVITTSKFFHRCIIRPDDGFLMLGWIVTFIIGARGGGPSSGYISAGFFGGREWSYFDRSLTHN